MRNCVKAIGIVLLLALGCLPTSLALEAGSTGIGDAEGATSDTIMLKVEVILPSPLGPSFAIATGEINGKSYGFLGSAAGIVIFDMTDPKHPKVVASLLTRGAPNGLFLFGTRLFSSGGAGSSVIDVSDPQHPVEVQFLPTIDEARDVVFDPERELALVIDFLGLRLIDVSKAESAENVGAMPMTGPPFHLTLDATRDIALLVGDSLSPSTRGYLRLIDVSKPKDLTLLGNLEFQGSAYDVAIDAKRQLALVVGRGDGRTRAGSLHVIDISAPTKPAELGQIETPGTAFGVAVDTERRLAIVVGDGPARGTGSLRLIDLSAPEHPVDITGMPLPSRALGVFIDSQRKMALVAGGFGLLIVRF